MSSLPLPQAPRPQCLVALSLLPWLFIFSVNAASFDISDTVPRVLPTVVHIAIGNAQSKRDPSVADSASVETQVAPEHRGTPRTGSGIIISEDGYILTAAHLFDSPDHLLVRLHDRREFAARLVGRDQPSNVALLKINVSGLSVAKIGDPRKLRLAERVFAVGGLPSGLSPTVTDGIVSAKETQQSDFGFIQTTVLLYPSMGGGPLFSQNGEVMGINVMIYSRVGGQGASFAIPINDAMRVASELRAHGHVQRGTFGIVVQEITADIAEVFRLPKLTGVLVYSVQKDMPGSQAGIVEGDIILRIGTETMRSPDDVARLVVPLKPGTTISVEVWRFKSGQVEKLKLVVADAGDRDERRSHNP